ncbi:MAG: hypothetical protein HYR56_04220 [Acidobacteria bacterium]|nr:hypothetical protein [Acidobacteriota bacterium]MBI3423774.1 hypothetical protein [Acidobacteriota bacterium]
MHRLFPLLLISTAVLAGACREKAQTNTPPNAQAAPTPAAAVVTVSPQPAGSVNPNQAVAVPGQMPKNLNDIPERLRRPLTLEEIKQLPPETRDMILKAIGQPVPTGSPAPSPKKK